MRSTHRKIGCFAGLVWAHVACGQVSTQVEDFEFASGDAAAAAGVTDVTDPQNQPSFIVSGNGGTASEGQFSIGTDALFGASGVFAPGTFIGFRRAVDPVRFPQGQMDLVLAYGDPRAPGGAPPDAPLNDLQLIGDFYGNATFAEGPTGTHLWINLIDAEGEVFRFVNFSETSLYFPTYTLDVVIGTGLIGIDPQSLMDIPDGDRLLTEIVAFEVRIQDADDPPTTAGLWYIDNFRIVEPINAALAGSVPANNETLWRTRANVMRLGFDANIVAPQPGDLLIRELLPDGLFGPDLSVGFDFVVEPDAIGRPRVLMIDEDDKIPFFEHRKWFAIQNAGWTGVDPFTVHYVVQVGDVNNDGAVLNNDASLINVAIPEFNAADDDRRDINGDGLVLNGDVSDANAAIPSFPVPIPSGH